MFPPLFFNQKGFLLSFHLIFIVVIQTKEKHLV